MVHERTVGVGSTLKCLTVNTVFINDTDISKYGALLESFTVGGTAITNDIFQGRNRTNYNVLATTFGRRSISFSLFFKALTRRELTLNKSALDSMLYGKVELYLPDEYYYTAFVSSIGELNILGVNGNEVIALCSYTLEGIRHGELITSVGNSIFCESTMPFTDCKLSCKASAAYASLTVDTVTITNVRKNDEIVVDGINGRILQNGAPCAGNMSFLHFPRLVPEGNLLQCPETLTVEYYPTYI